jgi:hypothetical protein
MPEASRSLRSHSRTKTKGKHHEIWIALTNKKFADPQPVSFNEAVSEAGINRQSFHESQRAEICYPFYETENS